MTAGVTAGSAMRPLEIVAGLAVLAGVAFAVSTCDRAGSKFSGDLERFFVEPAEDLPDVDAFHRRGRVLVLDTDNHRLDAIHDLLPLTVRAEQEADVGSVALVHCEKSVSGYYIPLVVKGYNHDCHIRLVALPSRAFIANFGTALSPPSRVRLPFWNRHAPRPERHLAEALAQLPDRGAEDPR